MEKRKKIPITEMGLTPDEIRSRVSNAATPVREKQQDPLHKKEQRNETQEKLKKQWGGL